jgi:hypothetical protein
MSGAHARCLDCSSRQPACQSSRRPAVRRARRGRRRRRSRRRMATAGDGRLRIGRRVLEPQVLDLLIARPSRGRITWPARRLPAGVVGAGVALSFLIGYRFKDTLQLGHIGARSCRRHVADHLGVSRARLASGHVDAPSGGWGVLIHRPGGDTRSAAVHHASRFTLSPAPVGRTTRTGTVASRTTSVATLPITRLVRRPSP